MRPSVAVCGSKDNIVNCHAKIATFQYVLRYLLNTLQNGKERHMDKGEIVSEILIERQREKEKERATRGFSNHWT